MIQQYAEGWQQSVDRDPATGRERILATCTYPPSNMSFLLVVDPESKLIEGAKLWSNLQHEGEPYIDAQKFTYNEVFGDELFEVPADMTIVGEEVLSRRWPCSARRRSCSMMRRSMPRPSTPTGRSTPRIQSST